MKKKKPFQEKLARYPSKLRYLTPKQFWMAMRLGLYQTVLSKKLVFVTPKLQVVQLIATLKRQLLSQEEAQKAIWSVLNNHKLTKYHREFVRELFYLYPSIFADFFIQYPKWLKDEYYIGLYLSYVSKNHINDDFIQSLLHRLSDNTDKLCIINNLDCFDKSHIFNQILINHQLLPIYLQNNQHSFVVNNLCSSMPYACHKSNKVSILVTAYNAQNTLSICLQSLLNQTWQSLEVIVIDDASTDDTFSIVQAFVKQDKRVIGIHLPKNVGTFVAKSIGAKFATGEFLTCQDSDDFAHPQKIERQTLPLIDNMDLIATTSHWLRLDDNEQFYVRQYYPFLRQNPASPLFRRLQVEQEIGLWHLVRAGADSEFWHRLKLYYGDSRILSIKEPLTIASHRTDSLMNAGEFSVHDKISALRRLDYWETWNLWHIECLSKKINLAMPSIGEQIINPVFEVDERLLVNPDDIRYNLENLTIEK